MEIKSNKAISTTEAAFLGYLTEVGKSWFRIEDAYGAFPNKSGGAVRFMLMRMLDKGLLIKVSKKAYWVVPFGQDADSYIPDWHLLAEPLAGDSRYYIGYYSALQIHGLITQPSLKEQVVRERHKTETVILKGVEFQFIYHNAKHFFGVKKVWIDSYNKVPCSDLEKTMIDCLYMPAYAGGIVEVAKALWMAREKLNYDKLLEYAKRFDSQVVMKRLGYLLDKLEIQTEIIEQLHGLRSATVSPLDTEVPNVGKISTKWSIRQNVDIETILNAINN